MAVWNPKSFDITQINGNTRYEDGNIPNAEAIDAAIEGAAFAQDKAEEAASSAASAESSASAAEATANNMMSFVNALTDPPDLTDVGNVGTPSVSFVANGEYKKFKFSNLKGEKGDIGASISDVNFIYSSETSTETIYDVQTVLADGTIVDSGQITIPKTAIPVISEFAEGEQTQPSADLMIGGFFFTEVQ